MTDHAEVAARLRDAYTAGQVPPLRDALEPGDVENAYAIQAVNTRHWHEAGRRIVGRKVGLTAKAVQQQLGVNQPDFGVLFDDMLIADGGTLDPGRTLQPKAEAEIAIRIGRDLPAEPVDRATLARAVSGVMAAIEIVDSRIVDWKITFADTVADNGSSAFFVLGQEEHALAGLDLYSCGMVLEVDGAIASLGAGAACLGHPLDAAVWLANTLSLRGEPLRESDVIMTGALGPMVAIKPGQHIRAVVGGIGECSFRVGEAGA